MRLAACALSAVLLSGCSWLGFGGDNYYGASDYYGYGAYAGSDCAPAAVGHTSYAYSGGQAGCAAGASYAVGHGSAGHGAGHGAHGLRGAHGHAHSAGYGQGGSYGSAYGSGAYGANGTVLGSAAPYGSAVGAGMGVPGTNPVGGVPGQVVSQTVYGPGGNVVGGFGPQGVGSAYAPYGSSYYGGNTLGALGGAAIGAGSFLAGGAMPFGVEASVGTEFGIGGDVFPGEASKPFLGGPGNVSALPAVAYDDAFDNAVTYELAAAYDLDPSTTVFGQVGWSKAEGKQVQLGTVDDGAGVSEDLVGQFSDYEQIRVEGGVRKYVGHSGGLRPYVGGSAGFVKTDDVSLTQSSATLVDPALFQQTYLRGGWNPTAAGIVGAEWQTGARTAIGIETGVRWTQDQDTNFQSDDIWSVPLKLRGRVAF